MYSTIRFGTASKATPLGRRLYRARVGFELAIKRSPARRLDHSATTSLIFINSILFLLHCWFDWHVFIAVILLSTLIVETVIPLLKELVSGRDRFFHT
jgi:hypothetical protein